MPNMDLSAVRWHLTAGVPHPAGWDLTAARVVKSNPFRTISRIVRPEWDVHLKHCRPHGLRAWLREWLRPAKARLEHDNAVALAARGVPVLEPLGWGTAGRWLPGDSFLITRTLDGAEPLGAFLEATLPTLPEPHRSRVRQRIASGLGELFACLHRAGVIHPDPHPGNLLVTFAYDEPRFHLLDVHAVSLGPSLGWPAARSNLVLFNRWFQLRASRADRLRFWRSYVRTTEWPDADDRARDLETRTWDSNRRFWRGRERRCLGTNRYFRRLRAPGIAGHAVHDLDHADLADLLTDPNAPFRSPVYPLLKDSRSSTVAELDLRVGGSVRRVILKRFRVTAWHDPFTALVRPTAALRSWRTGHALIDARLLTARPLAMWHHVRAELPYDGYLLTEKINDARELHKYLRSANRLAVRDCIDRVARLIAALHHRGWRHRDLKAGNVLVTSTGEVCLIDLVGVSRGRPSPDRRARDLSRLNVSFLSASRSMKLRFLFAYLGAGLHGRDDWKRWWRKIARFTVEKVERNARRGRVLG